MQAKLQFQDLTFEKKSTGIRTYFLKAFYFDVDPAEFENIGPFEIESNSITFDGMPEHRARSKFNFLLEKHLPLLKNLYTKKSAIFIHKGSGIPLIGYQGFGIIDRNTSFLEIRPLTGCNLNCNYCSVDEGLSTRKIYDFVIEKDYLVEELKKVIEQKNCDEITVHIGTQGEPTIYGPLIELVRDIKAIPKVKEIEMVSNGMLLTEEYVDKLAEAGMTRINISLNAMDTLVGKKIAGHGKYDVEHSKKICRHIAKKMQLIIAPTFLPGMNDDQMKGLVLFGKEVGAKMGIQNFLYYRYGRNPIKSMPWEKFYELLQQLESETGVKLIMSKEDYKITHTNKLPKPFMKGETIDAEIMVPGRLPGEAIAVAQGRSIMIREAGEKTGKVRVKIDRSKHNIFVGHLA